MKPVVGDLRSAFKISTQIDFFIRSEERLNATDKRSTCHFQHRFHHKYFGLAPRPRAAHVAPSLPTSTRREPLPAWRGASRDVPGDSATSRLCPFLMRQPDLCRHAGGEEVRGVSLLAAPEGPAAATPGTTQPQTPPVLPRCWGCWACCSPSRGGSPAGLVPAASSQLHLLPPGKGRD